MLGCTLVAGGSAVLKFSTTLMKADGNATGIVVPDEVVAALGAGKRPPVTVTINGAYTYRNTIAVMGGRYMVGVAAEHRAGAGIAGGDAIEVDIALDAAPRAVEVPEDLAAALAAAGAREAFDRLAFSHRKEHVRAISEAKAADTRARRIAKAVEMVGGKSK
jgi:hypothetical protein